MNIIQYTATRSSLIYGMKRYNEGLNNQLNNISIKNINHTRGTRQLTIYTLYHYLPTLFNRNNTIHHFTDPNMVFMGEYHVKNSIISLMDCIEQHYYYEEKKVSNFRSRNFPRFDKIVTISNYSKNDISVTYNIDLQKIAVVPCAVDSDTFYYENQIEHFNSKNTISLLYVGNTMPHKNLQFIIGVAKELKKCLDQPVVFNRVGYTDKNNEYQSSEYQRIKDLADTENVNFNNLGLLSNDDLRHAYNTSDIYVAPSLCEGFNLPIIEAMSCGTPVVASNNSSHPEVVGKAGALVDLNIDSWVEAILNSLEIRNDVQLRIEHAKTFNWDRSADELMKVYYSMN